MWKINYKFIARVVGIMCVIEGFVLLLCVLISMLYDESLLPFLMSFAVFITIGLGLFLPTKDFNKQYVGVREGMLTVTLTWFILSLLGAFPFYLSHAISNPIDAFFETVSGFTTTGATILKEVESLPHGILFWRSITQWQGGVGIVVFSIALLPLLGGGAGKLYNAETTGVSHDRFLPRISQVAQKIFTIYIFTSTLLLIMLWAGPMNFFDSVCHTLTCVSTGGFSTKNDSISFFNSPYVEYVVTAFMFIGSLNLTLFYFAILGRNPQKLFKNEEFRWFLIIVLMAVAVTFFWLWYHHDYNTVEETLRHAMFQVVSLISSTGYLTADIVSWRPFFWLLAITLMTINGCSGSTCGGIKTERFMILIKNLSNEFKKRVSPSRLVPVRVNGSIVSTSAVHQVIAFIFVYVALIAFGSMLLMLDDNTFVEGISAAATAISNSGPALGNFAFDFASAGSFTKLVMCFLMIAGRLEVFTVITILTPAFWRR